MPLYHFHLWTSEAEVLDVDGTTLPSDHSARAHAERIARELIKAKEVERRTWHLDVARENGAILFQVPFSAAEGSLDHLDASPGELAERLSASRSATAATIFHSKFLTAKTRPLNRRATGRLYVAASGGRRGFPD